MFEWSLKVGKLHSFANFGLWVSQCDLQMCAMCVGFSRVYSKSLSNIQFEMKADIDWKLNR